MFKFNFGQNEENENKSRNNLGEKKYRANCEKIKIDAEHIKHLEIARKNCSKFIEHGFQIDFISSKSLCNDLEVLPLATDITQANSINSDLISGIYEGGAKIWECTKDLLIYFLSNYNKDFFKNKSILDLGCGVGLLGIFSLKQGADKVCFQDYNQDVLENVTILNVLLNSDNLDINTLNEKYEFYSGDWEKFLQKDDNKYDFILTSETIYETENYEILLKIFEKLVKKNGIIFLAAKTYYFGVGGSVREFEIVIENSKKFHIEKAWKNSDGISREILIIKKID